MADYGSGAALGGLNVGNLVVGLSLNASGIQGGLNEIKKSSKTAADILKSNFDAAGGVLGNLGERIGNVGKNIEKMFGDKAPAALQKMGSEMQRALGISDAQVKGLKQTVESLEGAFKLAGEAVKMLLSPLGAVLVAALGVAAAVGAIKNAADGGKRGGVSSTSRYLASQYQSNQQWVMDNVPGAQWAAGAASWAGDRAKSDWNRAANTPGSFVETFSKATPLQDISNGLNRTLDDLADALKPVMEKIKGLMEPGATAEQSRKSAESIAKKRKDADEALTQSLLDLADADKQRMEAEKAFDAAISAELIDMADADKEAMDAEDKLRSELRKQQKEQIEREIEAAKEAEQQRLARWEALGSGKFGTALGIGNTEFGGALNIVGGAAASQGRLTGTALQGAAQGGQAGGPWGAVIGAIVALATETEAFRKLIGSIEGALGEILPILSSALDPIVGHIGIVLDSLRPIFSLIQGLGKALQPLVDMFQELSENVMGPTMDALSMLSEGIMSVLGDLVSGVTGFLEQDLGDGYSFMDYATGGALITEAVNGIKKATGNDDATKKQNELNAARTGWGQLSSGMSSWDLSKQKGLAINEQYTVQVKDSWTGNIRDKTFGDSNEMIAFKTQWNEAVARQKEEEETIRIGRLNAERDFLAATGMTLAEFEKQQEQAAFLSSSLESLTASTKEATYSLDVMADSKWLEAYEDDYMAMREAQDKKKQIDDELEAQYRALHPELYALADSAAEAASAADKLSEALSNIPVGYKLKSMQYQAAEGGTAAGSASSSSSSGGGGGGGGGSRGVTIVVDGSKDPAAVAKAVKELLDRDMFLTDGTLVQRASQF